MSINQDTSATAPSYGNGHTFSSSEGADSGSRYVGKSMITIAVMDFVTVFVLWFSAGVTSETYQLYLDGSVKVSSLFLIGWFSN